jgi:anti-sigma factor RsiW
VTAAHDHEELHHVVDRLPPTQARRLLVLLESDPELARYVHHDVRAGTPRSLSIIGVWDSGRADVSEHHDDYIRERMNRPT